MVPRAGESSFRLELQGKVGEERMSRARGVQVNIDPDGKDAPAMRRREGGKVGIWEGQKLTKVGRSEGEKVRKWEGENVRK